MDKDTLQVIERNLIDSVNWVAKNSASMDYHRVEGELSPVALQTAILNNLAPYKKTVESLSTQLQCGFEIEFYLQPEKIPELENQIAEILPDYQMLLITLDEVPKTNHRNFYLIKENTGQAPKNMQSYEIVSPIIDYKSLPYFINSLFNLLQKMNAQDNDSIGFHLHVSTQSATKISPIALLYFLDQEDVLNNKERKYTRDIIKQFFNYAPDSWQWIFEEVTRKCYNVNLLHYDANNHIELRTIGGNGYLDDAEATLNNCFNCFIAFEKALHTPANQVAKNILQTYSLKQEVLHTQKLSYADLSKKNQQQVWFV